MSSMTSIVGRKRCALSLIELVVVVAVSALLLSQLVTVAAGARKKSRGTTCVSRMGQIARASLIYSSSDPRENTIPVNATANLKSGTYLTYYGYGGKSGIGGTATEPFGSIWGPSGEMHALTRPLNAVLYKQSFPDYSPWSGPTEMLADSRLDLEVFHCPEDDSFPGMHHRGWRDMQPKVSSYDYYGTSYTCNPMWLAQIAGTTVNMYSNAVYLRAKSSIPNPGNTIAYWENAARYAVFARNPEYSNEPPDGCRPFYEELDGVPYVAHGWHGADWNFNASFADGHVGNVYVRSYETIDLPEPSYECVSDHCTCILARGDGWQLDTQPAPIIPSGHRPGFAKGAADGGSGGLQVAADERASDKDVTSDFNVVP